MKVLATQSCLTLCNPTDYKPPGSSVHGILQARILEWVAMPFPGGSSWPRDQIRVYHIAGRFFTIWATKEAPYFRWTGLIYSFESDDTHKLYRDHLLLFHPTDDACLRLMPVRNAVWELELVDNVTFCDFVQEKSVEPSR